jgi:hypothetical protein
MSDWKRKDVWSKFGKDFMVEISRHEVENIRAFEEFDAGNHRWAVYAYIYPKHPHFAQFVGPAMWQDASSVLPLHGGPSLLRWHRAYDGTPTSVQIGADYSHLHDACFTLDATESDATVQFSDAQELFDWLQADAEAIIEKATGGTP